MRRSKPSKRTYQVLLAIDDSLSMAPANRGGGGVAVEAMAVLARALSRLRSRRNWNHELREDRLIYFILSINPSMT
jgi:hypothetical protein